jgi:flagellar basal-body rod modification protein FlgD
MTNVTTSSVSPVSALLGGTSPTGQATSTKNNQMGQVEFMQLLIAQLKNQDPEAPVDSKEFAVQLAQFTQVEKLSSIDDKLGKQADNTLSSIAGYLGQQVTLNATTVSVKGGQGGQLAVSLSGPSSEVNVQLMGKDGNVVGTKSFSNLPDGKNYLSLDGLGVSDGAYGFKVSALRSTGAGYYSPTAAVSGVVTGFIPGPDPKLVVGDQEFSVSGITEVAVPPKK